MEREYSEEIPDYADIFELGEWKLAIDEGFFGNYDGIGYWVKDGKESRDEVFHSRPLDATHVTWYNK